MAQMKDNWLSRLYQVLWSRLGGRPWTHIIRDDQRRQPLLYLVLFFSLGAALGRDWRFWAGFGLGVLSGHFWW
jgi:hypothetical protein